MNEENDNEQNDSQGALTQGVNGVRKTASSANQKRKGMQKIVQKATAKNAALKGAATVVKGFLIKFAIIILIIIFVVGIIAFFLTIPGMVMENLKKLVKALGDGLASWFGKGDETFVENSQIYEVMDYLETMGYGLKEDGFLTDFVRSDISDDEVDKIISEKFDKENGTMYVDTEQGVLRDDQDKIIGAYSEFVMNYIISDNYMYTVRNYNVNTKHWYEALWEHFAGLFSDSLKNRTGMITLYHANDNGTPGTTPYRASELGSIEVDPGSKTMTIQLLGVFDYNEPMEYSLEGWTGRYGMPLEFLLSVHAATMMPDLAYDMQQAFATEVAVQLVESHGEAAAMYQGENGDITYETLTTTMTGVAGRNIFSAIIAAIDNAFITSEEFNQVIELGLVPPCHKKNDDGTYACGCKVDEGKTAEVVIKSEGDSTVTYPVSIEEYTENGVKKTRKYITVDGTKEYVTDSQITKKESFVVGDECRRYLENVMGMLGKENDYSFNTYVPYIEKVKEHWFRDVYFMISEGASDDLNIVDYDYDYESLVKERWTLYEVWKKNDPDGDYPELIGYQKLYEVKPGGELGELQKDPKIYELGGVITDKDGNTVKRYVKKAVTNQVSSIYEDYRWKHQHGYYSAYDFDQDNTHSRKPLYTAEQIEAETDELKKAAMEKMFIDVETVTILQTGDGMRVETNPLIKDMFVNNYYFRYDHDLEKAEAIVRLRKEQGVEYGPVYCEDRSIDFRDKTTYMKDPDDPKKTINVTAEELAGHVELNSDNLAAFNMLENMHTLDADYIYRDFKELVVELGYFNKEDLTENYAELLAFPVPEIGSGGYPIRILDKNEHTIGTLMHSKKDYDALSAQDIGVIARFFSEIEEDPALKVATMDNVQSMGGINSLSLKTQITDSVGNNIPTCDGPKSFSEVSLEEWLEKCDELMTYQIDNNYRYYSHPGGSGGGALKATWEEGKTTKNVCCATYVSWCLQEVGVMDGHSDYCGGFFPWIMEVDGVEVISSLNELKEGDIMFYSDTGQGWVTEANEITGKEHVDIFYGWENGSPGGNFWIYSSGHCNGAPCGKEGCGGGGKSLRSGAVSTYHTTYFGIRLPWSGTKQNDDPFKGYNGNEAVVSPVTGILLEYGTYGSNETNTKSTRELDNGDEVITEYYRTNVDLKYGVGSVFFNDQDLLTEEDDNTQAAAGTPSTGGVDESTDVYDKVGYAKILVLNQEYYEKLDPSHTYCSVNGDKYSYTDPFDSPDEYEGYLKIPNVPDSHKNRMKTIWGYKEFLEDYTMVGLDGYIVYIDGFVCETPDTELANELADKVEDEMYKQQPTGDNELTMDDFRIGEYQLAESTEGEKPKILNLYEKEPELFMASEKATNKQNYEAEVRNDSFPCMEVDGTIFIKEGTVLGRTMTDKELIEGTARGFNIRENETHDFDYYRLPEDKEPTVFTSLDDIEFNPDGTIKYEGDKVMGNYLRIQFFDKNGENVENVEDFMKLDDFIEDETIGKIEEFMYWQAKEPEGFEFVIDGVESYALAVSGGSQYVAKARRDNAGDKYGHDYGIDGIENSNDINLCPGMCFRPSLTENVAIWKSVTGQPGPTIGNCSVFCTGEQLLDIYQQILDAEIKYLKDTFPALADLEDDDTRIFGLIDVMYAGSGNFEIGPMAGKLRAGDLNLTLDDFLANATPENTFYSQNPEGLIRRRAMDYYIYAEGKYGCDLYDKKSDGSKVSQRYEFISDTPFQDLMVDKEGAKRVSF